MEPYRYCVSLRIVHPTIEPVEITRTIGLEPAINWKAGDPRTSPKGKVLCGVRSESVWIYKPHGEVKLSSVHKYIEDYLFDLTLDLIQHKDFFKKIVESGGHIEYFIGLFSEYSIGSVFPAALLRKISDLNIDLSFDIYAYPE